MTETEKAELRRLIHEFATYAIWHLSLTKPSDVIAIRILVNELMAEWTQNGFTCGTPNCQYCTNDVSRKFRGRFRQLIGKTEKGRRRV